jgi:thymidylate synthase
VENAWNIPTNYSDGAKRINAKFKNLRRAIELWAKQLPYLKHQIDKVNSVIELLDVFEEFRTLNHFEWNLREILKARSFPCCKIKNLTGNKGGKSSG